MTETISYSPLEILVGTRKWENLDTRTGSRPLRDLGEYVLQGLVPLSFPGLVRKDQREAPSEPHLPLYAMFSAIEAAKLAAYAKIVYDLYCILS